MRNKFLKKLDKGGFALLNPAKREFRFQRNYLAGFTMIEMIIAIFVIVLGVLAVYAVVQLPVIYTSNSMMRLTAAYLAQEGIEIVRNIRDYNVLNGSDWLTNLSDGDRQADYNDTTLTLYNGQELNLETTGFYGYGDPVQQTKFIRKITLALITDSDPITPDYLSVVVRMDWTNRGKADELEVQENLYQWWPPE